MNPLREFVYCFCVGLALFLVFTLKACSVHALELCRSEQDAAKQTLALEQYEKCKAEVSEWEQYSTHKEAEITAKDSIISSYKEQVAKDEKVIGELKNIALKPTPKFKVLLSPAFYIEARAFGSVSSDLLRGGVRLDVIRVLGVTIYGKIEGALRDEGFSNILTPHASRLTPYAVYGGAEWRPFK